MKKFKIRYIIFAILLSILIFNEGNRSFFRRFFERKKLKAYIEHAQYEYILLNKKIYNLENELIYLECDVRNELNVKAPEEIEYRFLYEYE
jgi:hypothetical protein